MHIPVLLHEAIDALDIKKGETVVDATLGEGGHAKEMIERVGKEGTFIGFDLDNEAIGDFQNKEKINTKSYLINENFAKLSQTLSGLGIEKVDAILADLGWRAGQIENEKYGMSFQKEGPLDMRLGNMSGDISAAEIINKWPEHKLVEIFQKYGEERHAKLVARAIVRERRAKEIRTTISLAELIRKSIGFKYKNQRIDPATRIFQALRIVVNNELENLEVFLPQALTSLQRGGRLAIITFHSLEDRIVKQFFKAHAGGCVCPKEIPICVCGKKPVLKIITRKPIVASEEEIKQNPRSRSAKLRVAQKL